MLLLSAPLGALSACPLGPNITKLGACCLPFSCRTDRETNRQTGSRANWLQEEEEEEECGKLFNCSYSVVLLFACCVCTPVQLSFFGLLLLLLILSAGPSLRQFVLVRRRLANLIGLLQQHQSRNGGRAAELLGLPSGSLPCLALPPTTRNCDCRSTRRRFFFIISFSLSPTSLSLSLER